MIKLFENILYFQPQYFLYTVYANIKINAVHYNTIYPYNIYLLPFCRMCSFIIYVYRGKNKKFGYILVFLNFKNRGYDKSYL